MRESVTGITFVSVCHHWLPVPLQPPLPQRRGGKFGAECFQLKRCSARLETRCTLRSAEVRQAGELLKWYSLKSHRPVQAAQGEMGDPFLNPGFPAWCEREGKEAAAPWRRLQDPALPVPARRTGWPQPGGCAAPGAGEPGTNPGGVSALPPAPGEPVGISNH